MRSLLRRLWYVTHQRRAADDLAEELETHHALAQDRLKADGLLASEAARAARRQLGNLTLAAEDAREVWIWRWLDDVWRDVRHTARSLRRSPGFALVAILSLAMGIGATTTIASAVNPILLDALPYPSAAQLVSVADSGADRSRIDVTFGTFREVLARSRSFDALAVMKVWQPTIVGVGQPERLEGQRVSAAYFRVLGVAPIIGRDFDAADDRANGPNVVILSDDLWRRRLAADPTVIGRAITLDDSSFTVIGVMPRGFENLMAPSARLWAPLQYDPSLPTDGREWGHHLRMAGRLRPKIDLDQVRRELQTIAATRVPDFVRPPWAALANGLLAASLQDEITRDVKPALVAVLGAVLLLLSITCVNVMTLQVARGGERKGEFAMRAALGAGRGRLVRQLVTESALMAFAAGVVGLFLAHLGVEALLGLSPATLPRADAIVVDARAFAFGLAVAAAVGLIGGLVAALTVSHDEVIDLQHASTRIGGGRHTTRRVLVVAEIGLALVLLVGAGLLFTSLRHLFSIAPGFDPSRLVTMQVQTSGRRLRRSEAALRFFEEALDAVRRVPGVEMAGFTSQLPLSGSGDMFGVHLESRPSGQTDADRGAFRYAVTPGYLEAMGVVLRRGRVFDAHDAGGAPNAVLISESLAQSRFGGTDAIGQRMRIGPTDGPLRTVVGVVGNVRQVSLAENLSDAVYVPNAQWMLSADRAMWLVVRAHGDARTLEPAIKSAIWSVDPDQPIVRVATMDDLVTQSAAVRRFATILLEAFALAALGLAAIGIYGILSGSVAERTREIGVRMALGATRSEVMRLVLDQSLMLTAAGVGLGLVGAAFTTRYLESLLFGLTPLDPPTFIAVSALLVMVAAIAAYLPARRATKVDPLVALRCE